MCRRAADVDRAVHALLAWSSELGGADAATLLEEFYAAGKLPRPETPAKPSPGCQFSICPSMDAGRVAPLGSNSDRRTTRSGRLMRSRNQLERVSCWPVTSTTVWQVSNQFDHRAGFIGSVDQPVPIPLTGEQRSRHRIAPSMCSIERRMTVFSAQRRPSTCTEPIMVTCARRHLTQNV